MVWQINIDSTAEKQLSSMHSFTRNRIITFLNDHLSQHQSIYGLEKTIHCDGTKWRFTEGDFILIAEIYQEKITIFSIQDYPRNTDYKDY